MKKSCIITIIFFFGICLITGISVNATNKTSSAIWEKNCSFVNGNRESMKRQINYIITQNISIEDKVNDIKKYISSLYKDNGFDIENIDVVIENIPDSEYIVIIDYSIKHCKKSEKMKFIIKKEVI